MKSKKITTGVEMHEHPLGANIVQDTAAQREQMIATAAYFHAEKRGFAPSDDLADWFKSEIEIENHLNSVSDQA
ncbi:MAG: DUF2934 domain-containing protein [Sulfuricellaceae bacterium]